MWYGVEQLAGAGFAWSFYGRTKLPTTFHILSLHHRNSTAAIVPGPEHRLCIPAAPMCLYPEMRGIDHKLRCDCSDVKCLHCSAHRTFPAMAKQSVLAVYSRQGTAVKDYN